jgi:hypothetical protein
MTKATTTEQWKTVVIPVSYANNLTLQISNFGRLKSFNKNKPDGNIIKGSITNGYPIVRLKLFKERTAEMTQILKELKDKVDKLRNKIAKVNAGVKEGNIEELNDQFVKLNKKYQRLQKQDAKERVINYHSLTHRLVAEYFLPKPKINEIIVAHLDYNKCNNNASNLKWMTVEENLLHQQKNPTYANIEVNRKEIRYSSKASKLTVTKVMLLKKMINLGKPTKALVKQFKITDMQISRIKRGENWGDIPAAN